MTDENAYKLVPTEEEYVSLRQAKFGELPDRVLPRTWSSWWRPIPRVKLASRSSLAANGADPTSRTPGKHSSRANRTPPSRTCAGRLTSQDVERSRIAGSSHRGVRVRIPQLH